MAVRTLSINLVTLLNVAVESATVTLSLMANDQTGSSTVVISSSTAVTNASGDCTFSNVIPNVDGSQDRRYHCTAHDGLNELFNVEFQMPDADSRLNDLIDVVASDSNRIPYLDGNQTFTGTNTFGTPSALKTTVFNGAINLDGNTITDFLDQDDMSSNSASAVSSQQSIKSYVDSKVATVDSLAEVLALGNTTGGNNIVVTAGDSISVNTIIETTAASGVTIDSVLIKDNTVTATTFVGALTGNATTVTTNANLTGDITSTGNATSIASGVIVNADVKSDAAIAYSKLGAIPTWNQNTSGNAATVTTNANLTGDITSTGNATSIASGVIVNADVKSDAAIAYSKLGTIPTWNQNTTGTAATVTTNANLTGDITSTGNATAIAAGVIINDDVKSDAGIAYSKLGAIPTWNQNTTGTAATVTTNANLTGDITSTGNATAIAAGVIINADVKSDAGIAYSKLGAVPTWNQNTTGTAATVTTNANLTGDITSTGNATSIAAGVIINADVKSDAAIAYSKLGTIPTWNQNTTGTAATVTTNANLTGDITSTGNATSIAAGVIINADVKSDAAIAYSKLGAIPTWNQNTTGTAATVTTANQPAITGLGTIVSLVATTADINDGTVDALIGATSPDAGTFTVIKANTSLELATGATVTGIDNGALGTSATLLATQGAIKTYVDAQTSGQATLTEVLAEGNATGTNDIEVTAAQKIQFRDAAIYLNSSADGQLDIVADTEIQIAATTIDINGNADVSGTLSVTGVVTANAGVVVDELTIDADTITATDDFIIDAVGEITLDADNSGIIYLKDAGTIYGQFFQSSNNFYIQSQTSDADILFRGNDGGNVFTALTLDMSDGGAAHFTNDIYLSDNKVLRMGDGQDFRLFHDGSHSTIQSTLSDGDILFKGNDGGSTITALTFDMSAAGAATFNAGVFAGAASSFPSISINNNSYIGSANNTTAIQIATSGATTFSHAITANAGVVVDNFTLDGTTLALSSGDMTLDVAGNIKLDADDNGEVRLLDGGTQYLYLKKDSNTAVIQNVIADGDIAFRGTDDSSVITALTLDMSAAGAATFNAGVTATTVSVAGGGMGTVSSDLFVGTGDTTLQFVDGQDVIQPTGTSGAQRSDLISLGDANNKFKDLNLSGGVKWTDGQVEINSSRLLMRSTGDAAGLRFDASSYTPFKNGSAADGTVDLGFSSGRFKDGHFSGTVNADKLAHDGDSNTYLDFGADSQTFYVGAVRALDLNAGGVYVNSAAIDMDFRVSSDSNADMLFVDGGNNRVGIGKGSPGHALSLGSGSSFIHLGYNGTSTDTEVGRISSNSYDVDNSSYSLAEMNFMTSSANGYTGAIQFRTNSVNSTNSRADVRLLIGAGGALTTTPAAGGHAVFNENGIDADFRVESDGNANMLFVDGGNNRVGIGTGSPAAPLNVRKAGDGTLARLSSAGVGDWDLSIGNTSTLTGVGAGALELLPLNAGTGSEFAVGLAGTTTALLHVKPAGTSITGTLGVTGVAAFEAGTSGEYTAVTSSSNAVSLNLQLGDSFSHDLTENTTISFANPAASGKVSTATLRIIQGSTARTITWHSSIKWAGDEAPTLSTGDDDVDIFVFQTVDGGTTYYGFTAGQDMS